MTDPKWIPGSKWHGHWYRSYYECFGYGDEPIVRSPDIIFDRSPEMTHEVKAAIKNSVAECLRDMMEERAKRKARPES